MQPLDNIHATSLYATTSAAANLLKPDKKDLTFIKDAKEMLDNLGELGKKIVKALKNNGIPFENKNIHIAPEAAQHLGEMAKKMLKANDIKLQVK